MTLSEEDVAMGEASSDEESALAQPHLAKGSKRKSKQHRQSNAELAEMMETILRVVRSAEGTSKSRARVPRRRVRKSVVEEVQAIKNCEPASIRSMLLVSVHCFLPLRMWTHIHKGTVSSCIQGEIRSK
jgi:hypothetical protein